MVIFNGKFRKNTTSKFSETPEITSTYRKNGFLDHVPIKQGLKHA